MPSIDGQERWDDRAVTIGLMAALSDRAGALLSQRPAAGDLPHPIVTDGQLGHHLNRATASRYSVEAAQGELDLPLLRAIADQQTTLDDALIHCFHQLDHRTTRQERRILELEVRLSEADRRIAVLESERA